MRTRKQRVDHQLNEWAEGNPNHNLVDDECCPDFSCCNRTLLQPEEIRKTFKKVCEKADTEGFNPDHHPAYDMKMSMLMNFLGSSIKNKSVYVSGSEHVKQN